MMEKCTLGQLTVEITRRCNLACKHCFRGDAQNLDISNDVIDNLCDLIIGGERLTITGGEPFLAFDKLEYLLYQFMDKAIVFLDFEIVTNGTLITINMQDIFKKFFEYMKLVYKYGYGKDFSDDVIRSHIRIIISADKYHNIDPDPLYDNAKNILGDYAFVGLSANGNAVKAEGRGKNLSCGCSLIGDKLHKIEILKTGRKCFCRSVKDGDQSDVPLIMCPVSLTAKGELLYFSLSREYVQEDTNPEYFIADLSHSNIDLIKSIDQFNIGKNYCVFNSDPVAEINIESAYDLGSLSSIAKADDRYKSAFEHLSDEDKFAIFDGTFEERQKQFADYSSQRNKADVMAEIMFDGYKDSDKYISVKQKYNYLTKKEVIEFTDSDSKDIRYNLLKRNYFRSAYSDLAGYMHSNHRLYNILRTYKQKIENFTTKNLDDFLDSFNISYFNTFGRNLNIKEFEYILDSVDLKSDYSNQDRYQAALEFFGSRFETIINDLFLDNHVIYANEEFTIYTIKDLFIERMGYANCYSHFVNSRQFNSFYERESINKNFNVRKIDIMKNVILQYESIIDCDSVLKEVVNRTDDSLNRDHTYDNQFSSSDYLKVLFYMNSVHKSLDLLKEEK